MTEPEPFLDALAPRRLRPRQARIFLDSLEVMVDIGFHDFEIGAPQRVLVTIELWIEPSSGSADDPAGAWDYDHLRELVEEIAAERRYNLQETLANAIFERICSMRGVCALRVSTAKPDIYPNAKAVGVEVASFVGCGPDR